jgi:hypothetical protein
MTTTTILIKNMIKMAVSLEKIAKSTEFLKGFKFWIYWHFNNITAIKAKKLNYNEMELRKLW